MATASRNVQRLLAVPAALVGLSFGLAIGSALAEREPPPQRLALTSPAPAERFLESATSGPSAANDVVSPTEPAAEPFIEQVIEPRVEPDAARANATSLPEPTTGSAGVSSPAETSTSAQDVAEAEASTTAAAQSSLSRLKAAAPKQEALRLLDSLVVAIPDPNRPPYDRDLFGGWADADGDCRNTRAEVLLRDAITQTLGTCTITAGRWTSAYEGAVLESSESAEIDHLVALGNAWGSGAWAWDDGRRRAFANDLAHPEHLVVTSRRVNGAKGDRSPDQWMIPTKDQPIRCAYLTNWTVVKARWDLSVTPAEEDTLRRGITSQC